MNKALIKTNYHFPGQVGVYNGKVRDVYNIEGKTLVMVATDRISAFDVILPEGIPYKGQVLNQIASKFLDATADICPNWKLATPDPMVTVGKMCKGFPVEMIVRGYLCGSAWRAYRDGARELCGVKLPEGMKENQKFPEPIITPTTKAEIGDHDENISKAEILAKGLATPEQYEVMEKYTLALFRRGTEIAAKRGLILVDTKYEFGLSDGEITLMDEIHTPDSSRYFYSEVCEGMAHGQRIPGQGRTESAGDDAGDRREHIQPLHRALRAYHRRKVQQGDSRRPREAHREERDGIPEQVSPHSTALPRHPLRRPHRPHHRLPRSGTPAARLYDAPRQVWQHPRQAGRCPRQNRRQPL